MRKGGTARQYYTPTPQKESPKNILQEICDV